MSFSQPPHTGRPAIGWLAEAAATLRVGLPLIAAQMGHQAISVTDTVMLGWYGPEFLAAGVLGAQLYLLAFIGATGFALGVMPLAASAAAGGDDTGLRRSVRMGLWVVSAVVAGLMPLLWNTGALMRALGQEPQLAAGAQEYVRIAQWSLFPALWAMVLRSYFSALERTRIVMWAMFAAVALNALLNWMLIFGNWGVPELGLRGAAIATLGTQTMGCLPLVIVAATGKSYRPHRLFQRLWRPEWDAFSRVFRIGLPISGALLAEVGLFAATTVMLGWLGTIALAAHGIAISIVSITFMVYLGLASAATVRVGRALGRKDREGLDRAGKTVLGMTAIGAVCGAGLIWFLAPHLVRLFLAEGEPAAEAIVAAGVGLLAVAAVFQVVDALQAVSLSLLRGLQDTGRPMLIAVVSYWVVGMPAAYVMGFVLGLGGPGVWAGLALGLALAGVLLTRRFLLRERLGLVRI